MHASPPARRRTLPPLALPLLFSAVLAGCGTLPGTSTSTRAPVAVPPGKPAASYFTLEHPSQSQEIVLYALGLLDVGYQFGGRNPEAGMDCSGMVSYIVEQISGRRLPHNAAAIAERTRPIAATDLRPGDLVFFNTLNRRHSHMGVYMGDGRFIHAPSSRGRIRIERLDNPYFAQRIDGARTLLARN
ncbi:NlpC/P60 family protein [Pseudothauera nasutitermitis]|uniref:NlpC/P60 family protein n=1 Tax=Pseudothauera nasutitermitis TaxID=2565930 RepID=A0A4V3WC93_9RHOO|nr:C40 family peptidase [Pseudothauera nasutitermitis]THF66248.1 NlpC/P60 family protein [Pseudothauera nasutitermitis]